jgi:hypothetical protein
MKKAWVILLFLAFCAAQSVFSQATERVEPLPDGSVLLSPQALSAIDETLTRLESNLTRQRELSTDLTSELSAAELSLTTLKGLYNEQGLLVSSLRIQWNLIATRLQDSDESYAWIQQDAIAMEAELTTARAAVQCLDRSARVWRTLAIVAGCLAVGAGVAAVVW